MAMKKCYWLLAALLFALGVFGRGYGNARCLGPTAAAVAQAAISTPYYQFQGHQ